MARIQVLVFTVTAVLWCGSAFSQPAGADRHVAEENAIQEACPARDAFGSGIPVGYRYDIQGGGIKRCMSVAEGRAAVAEENAIQEACPRRDAFGIVIPIGYRFDQRSGGTTRCMSAAEGNAAVAEEKAIHEACPRRDAFGIGIPIGYRFDQRSGGTTRCMSVAEGKAAVAEENAIQEACPEREAFGNKIQKGYRFDTKLGYITRCSSVAEGGAVIAEKKTLQEDSKPVRSENLPAPGGGRQPQQLTSLTYQDVLTPQELAWSNSLPNMHRATTQFSPAQIAQIKQDGRWEPWVAQTKAEVAGQSRSAGASQKPTETHPSPLPRREAVPVLTSRTLQARIEVSEKIIGDLSAGGMQQAASEKLAQAKREFQAGKLESSQALLHEANKYAALASQRARDNIDDKLPPIAKLPVIDRPIKYTEEWQKKLPRYGNFGGKGYTGGYDRNQTPINRMDELFEQHDKNYNDAKNQNAILLADKELVAGLENIDENNIHILKKDGSKGKLYGTLKDDIAYRDNAKKLFKRKISAQETLEGVARAGPVGVGAR